MRQVATREMVEQAFIHLGHSDKVLRPLATLFLPVRPWLNRQEWECFEFEHQGEVGAMAFLDPSSARLWLEGPMRMSPPSGLVGEGDWALAKWSLGYIEDVLIGRHECLFLILPNGDVFRHELPTVA